MKRATLTLTGALLLIAGMARADVRGEWTATGDRKQPGRLHLQLEIDHSNHGQTMSLTDFTGLTAAQLASPGVTPVSFSLRREAGTVTLQGDFRNGRGSGDFAFASNPGYLASLRDLGVSAERGKRHGDSAEEELLTLALLDVSTDFIRSMQAIGYHESLDDYLSIRIFKVTPELVAEYRDLGMKLSADDLVAGQIHGVSPGYVQQMRDLGKRTVSFDVRIHGVTPDFVAELAELGYRDLDADDLVAFRIHGVTPEFIRELEAEGERDLSPDDLVSMRIHGDRR
jgi:hypothetical protein